MSEVFRDPSAGWAAVLVVVLPLVIIGTGELAERLRQHDSPLRRPVAIVRSWVLPVFAVWALIRVVFAPDDDDFVRRAAASALVLAVGAAALAAAQVVVAGVRDRPRGQGRSVPRLVLALPRLLLVLAIAWTLIAVVWDIDLSAALTALGVTSLVVSFALQDTLGGIASGFTLLADQPFQVGDWIRSGDIEGRVVDINWRSSRVQTRDGDLLIVPNGQLASGTITNFDEPTRLHRLVVPVQVAFVNSPTDARNMLLAAAHSTPGVLAEPAPTALVVQVDDPLMGYEAHLWIDDYSIAPRVKSEFGALVWYHSHRRGVPLPSPAQDLYLWDGERSSAAGHRDRASLLGGLRTSRLLERLDDDMLDELVDGAVAERFAVGETIVGERRDDLVLIERGTAALVVRVGDASPTTVQELVAGDLVTAIDRTDTRGHDVGVVAVDDCDVITMRADVAGSVISRSPALNAAIEQVATSRVRRVRRLLRRLDESETAALSAAVGGAGLPVAAGGDADAGPFVDRDTGNAGGTDARDAGDGRDAAGGDDGVDGRDAAGGGDAGDGRDPADGNDGADGRDAADGDDGADGRDAADGNDGVDDNDGVDGNDGADGRDGEGTAAT